MVLDIQTLCKVKGYRVRLEVDKQEYEGIVVNVIPTTLCIALGKVRCLTDGMQYNLLYFYTYEIESCVTIKGPEELKKNPKKPSSITEEDGPRLVKLRPLPFHKREKANANTESNNLLIEGTDDKNDEYLQEDISDKSDDEDDILPSEKFRYPLPRTNVIIDVINDDFYQAISIIKNETVVGVALEGENIGRHGKICWISISTESQIYLFDILTLGNNAFENGLKDDVFQNPSVLKVFHDCREPSDALYHLFETRLVNIFDTQSSDALLQYKLRNKMPRYVRNLVQCIKDYLKIQISIPELSRTCYQQHSEKNTSVWIHRPLLKRYVKIAVKHCIFLKELRYSILERYLADLNCGAEIFLSIVRDSSEQELDLTLSTLNLLPSVFEKLETRHKRNTCTRRSFEAPLTESKYCEFSNTSDPYAAAGSLFKNKKNGTFVENIKFSEKTSEDSNEEAAAQGLKSGVDFDIRNGLCKPSDCFTPSPLKGKENCASINSKNEYHDASLQSEKCSGDILSRPSNHFSARSHPKKRIDWPKASTQASTSVSYVNVIPAGMLSTN